MRYTEKKWFPYKPLREHIVRTLADAPQAVIGAGASAVPEMFPHDPDPDPRQIAEKNDDEQEHDRDRFALHQESEPVSADQFELVLPPISHLLNLTLVPGRRLTGLLTITKISRAIFVNIEANYHSID